MPVPQPPTHDPQDETLVLTEHIYLFSRILLSNRQIFVQLMAASAPVLNQTEAVLYDSLLDKWWEKVTVVDSLSLNNTADLLLVRQRERIEAQKTDGTRHCNTSLYGSR